MLTKSFVNKRSSFSCFSEKNNFWSLNIFLYECFVIHLSYFYRFIINKFSTFLFQIFFFEFLAAYVKILNWHWEWRIYFYSWEFFNTFFFANLFPSSTIHGTYSEDTLVFISKLHELFFDFRFRFSIVHFIIVNNSGSTISFAGDLSGEIKLCVVNDVWLGHVV